MCSHSIKGSTQYITQGQIKAQGGGGMFKAQIHTTSFMNHTSELCHLGSHLNDS